MSEDKARRLIDRLQHLHHEAEAAGKSAETSDLSSQELRVLCMIGREHCPIMSAIAGAIRLSLSTATGLIDRLCEKKLVRRDRSVEDRRVVQVELTPEGRELHAAAMEGRVRYAGQLLGTLSPKEQEELLALLDKLRARAEVRRPG